MSNVLRIGDISEGSTIYGPGTRYVIWTQGCSLACEGCWNKQFWSKKGGYEIEIDELVKNIESSNEIQGITLLGGEPLQQPEAILKLIKNMKRLDLSVFLYTGYDISEFDVIMQSCFDNSDIVVTGRYLQEKRNTNLRWRGSTNQIIHFPTKRYRHFEIEERNEIEIIIDEKGAISFFGYPDEETRLWASEI